MRTYLLLLFIAVLFSKTSQSQSHSQIPVQEAVKECLQKLKHDYDIYLDSQSSAIKLGKGIIKEDSFSIQFPGNALAVQGRPVGNGIHVKFYDISVHPHNIQHHHYWPLLQLAMDYTLVFPGSTFDFEEQEFLMQLLQKAIEPINLQQSEKAKIAFKNPAAIPGYSNTPFQISLEGSERGRMVHCVFKSRKKVALSFNSQFLLISSDSAFNTPLPRLMGIGRISNAREIPFYSLEKNHKDTLHSFSFYRYPQPGTYKVRLAILATQDQWLNNGPTIVDGPPVIEKMPDAWTGLSISKEFTITVHENGSISVSEK